MAYNIEDHPTPQTIVAILACFVAVTGLLGNILVLVSVCLCRKLRTQSNAFVTSLAVCNLMTCVTLPYHTKTILTGPPKNLGTCTFFAIVTISTQVISLISLSLIAVLRACKVRACRCVGVRTFDNVFTKRNISVIIATSWIVPFLTVFVSSVTKWAPLGYNEKYNICVVEASGSGLASLVAGIVVGIPSLVITVTCYTLIFYRMRKYHAELKLKLKPMSPSTPDEQPTSTDQKGQTYQSSAEQSLSKRECSINRTLFSVVCIFIVSVVPFCTAIISPNINPAIPWCAVLLVSNSAINPIMYGVFHPQFHNVFQEILTCKSFDEIRGMITSVFGTSASNANSTQSENLP